VVSKYCGNNCETCTSKEKLNCPGCAAGPDGLFTTSCRLAQCCIRKGLESCTACAFSCSCGIYLGREDMPGKRIREMERLAAKKAQLAELAKHMRTWFLVLFWLFVPTCIGSWITNLSLDGGMPGLLLTGTLISLTSNLIYVVALYGLGRMFPRLKATATIILICTLLNSIFTILSALGHPVSEPILLTILAGFASLVAVCMECKSYSEALFDFDDDLARKWNRYWKWYLGFLGGFAVSFVLLVFSQPLGLLLVFVTGIGIVVLGILKLVYLHKSAKICGYFAAKPREGIKGSIL